jgi:mannose-6-phosphate isomerase-like protein (cupin superfamily)
MIDKIQSPTLIKAAGNKPKTIEEFIGRLNSGTDEISIARMRCPAGWKEPGQTPEFNEYTVVIAGTLRVETKHRTVELEAGQAVITPRGEWVRYSSPFEGGAEYMAVCMPAFSPETVHRDA